MRLEIRHLAAGSDDPAEELLNVGVHLVVGGAAHPHVVVHTAHLFVGCMFGRCLPGPRLKRLLDGISDRLFRLGHLLVHPHMGRQVFAQNDRAGGRHHRQDEHRAEVEDHHAQEDKLDAHRQPGRLGGQVVEGFTMRDQTFRRRHIGGIGSHAYLDGTLAILDQRGKLAVDTGTFRRNLVQHVLGSRGQACTGIDLPEALESDVDFGDPRLDGLALRLLERRHLVGKRICVAFAPHRIGTIAAGLPKAFGGSVLIVTGERAVNLAEVGQKRRTFGRQRFELSGDSRLRHHRGLTCIGNDRGGLAVETFDLVAFGGDHAVDPFGRGHCQGPVDLARLVLEVTRRIRPEERDIEEACQRQRHDQRDGDPQQQMHRPGQQGFVSFGGEPERLRQFAARVRPNPAQHGPVDGEDDHPRKDGPRQVDEGKAAPRDAKGHPPAQHGQQADQDQRQAGKPHGLDFVVRRSREFFIARPGKPSSETALEGELPGRARSFVVLASNLNGHP
ncbi:hypothetical protein SPO2720 [Ruegeria pomeroyi DSS-3]|uniref:Uncharacterized protein n=1 Tax=Ruegeria pomeroyi (strain ATCC 700808 / DSM 15171 / DSS-3) TaxID=246200 RepID=Q5LPX6_RUEPO|nr:hypothetical protein SPO2720 [Ruegeria pomeroyi DSS-3]